MDAAGTVHELHLLGTGHLAAQRAGDGKEKVVAGLEGAVREADAMHGRLHDGLHVLHIHGLRRAGGLLVGNRNQDVMFRHQRGRSVVEDRIGHRLLIAPVLVIDGEAGRRPGRRRIGILAHSEGETAQEGIRIIQLGEMEYRTDGKVRVEGYGVLAPVEKLIHKIAPHVIIVRFELDNHVGIEFVLEIFLVQAGGCQERHRADEGASYHFAVHDTKLHIFS